MKEKYLEFDSSLRSYCQEGKLGMIPLIFGLLWTFLSRTAPGKCGNTRARMLPWEMLSVLLAHPVRSLFYLVATSPLFFFAFSTSFSLVQFADLHVCLNFITYQVLMKSAGKRRQLLLGIPAIFPSVFVCFSGL